MRKLTELSAVDGARARAGRRRRRRGRARSASRSSPTPWTSAFAATSESFSHEIRDRRVAARAGRTRTQKPATAESAQIAAGEWTNGSTAKRRRAAEVGEDHHPLARPPVDQRADRDAEDHARDELAEEQDAHPPGRARLVVDRDPNGEERRPGAERRDQPREQEIAEAAVFGHADDRELRGELPQHPVTSLQPRQPASAVRNGRARAVEWRRWPAARGTHDELVAGVRAGDHRALARAISLVENRDAGALALVQELYPQTGTAFAVGVTGPPGVGKSSLIGALVRARALARASRSASSPSTPRARSRRERCSATGSASPTTSSIPGVFIRSMGTRGHLGRPRRGDAAVAPAARRRREGRRLPRDGRHGPERGRGDERSPTRCCSS